MAKRGAAERIGGSGEWRNWTGDQRCRPRSFERPADLQELRKAVAAAAGSGGPIRVPGSGHSFTEASLTDGTMIDVSALSGVIDADRDSGLVKIGGGTVLADLNAALHGLGLAMENLGDIDRQTIAGAISTATHGTGAGLPNISAQVAGGGPGACRRHVRELGAGERAAAGGAGGDRRSRGDRRGHAPLRAGLRPRPGRPPAAARGGARRLRRAGGGERPLRALHLPLRRLRPGSGEKSDRLGAAPARSRRRVPQRRRPRELGARGDLRRRQGVSAGDPDAVPARGQARLGKPRDRPQRPDLRQRAAGALHRDGVRGSAGDGPEAARVGDRVGPREPLPGLLPDRDAGHRRPTTPCSAPPTSATPPTSPSTSTGGWSGGPTSRRSRGSWTTTAAARTGASATSRPPRRWRRGTRAGTEFRAARDELDPGRAFANEYARRVLGP